MRKLLNTVALSEVDFFAISILGLMLWNTCRQSKGFLFEQKLFVALLSSNVVLLALDAAGWLLNGHTGELAKTAVQILNMLYYALSALPCVLWAVYAYYQIFRSKSRAVKLLIPLSIPFLITVVLSAASIFNQWFFYLDAQNVYHRGKLFWLYAFICTSYLFFIQLFILLNRRHVSARFIVPITLFPIPPLVGAIVQSFIYGVTLIWPCMTFSAMVVFLNIQNNQLYRDHLTGLYNRRHLDSFLEERINSKNHETVPAGIMVDLNCFKSINDSFGHSVGDRALVDAGKILRMSVRNTDFACRYGGDEFIVILEIKRREELDSVVKRISRNVERYNTENRPPFKMSFSMGYDILDLESGMSVKQFLCHIDELMYQQKKKSRR